MGAIRWRSKSSGMKKIVGGRGEIFFEKTSVICMESRGMGGVNVIKANKKQKTKVCKKKKKKG